MLRLRSHAFRLEDARLKCQLEELKQLGFWKGIICLHSEPNNFVLWANFDMSFFCRQSWETWERDAHFEIGKEKLWSTESNAGWHIYSCALSMHIFRLLDPWIHYVTLHTLRSKDGWRPSTLFHGRGRTVQLPDLHDHLTVLLLELMETYPEK